MAGSSTARSKRRLDIAAEGEGLYDRELEDLPPELRWREWTMRVEAVVFASAEPVSRETLARVIGKDCSIDLLTDDLREELSSRPYELVAVVGGWQHRTRPLGSGPRSPMPGAPYTYVTTPRLQGHDQALCDLG
jgi:chromosome segregation and condensation protein ScpB